MGEADEGCGGRITFEEFGKLVDLAAAPPRFFGLAPNTSDEATRRAMFDEMDSTKSGFITFRKFLRFARVHIRGKLAEHKKKRRSRGHPSFCGCSVPPFCCTSG